MQLQVPHRNASKVELKVLEALKHLPETNYLR